MALEINTVGVVGLGKMVGQLARHLASGGCDVVGYDLANGASQPWPTPTWLPQQPAWLWRRNAILPSSAWDSTPKSRRSFSAKLAC